MFAWRVNTRLCHRGLKKYRRLVKMVVTDFLFFPYSQQPLAALMNKNGRPVNGPCRSVIALRLRWRRSLICGNFHFVIGIKWRA